MLQTFQINYHESARILYERVFFQSAVCLRSVHAILPCFLFYDLPLPCLLARPAAQQEITMIE